MLILSLQVAVNGFRLRQSKCSCIFCIKFKLMLALSSHKYLFRSLLIYLFSRDGICIFILKYSTFPFFTQEQLERKKIITQTFCFIYFYSYLSVLFQIYFPLKYSVHDRAIQHLIPLSIFLPLKVHFTNFVPLWINTYKLVYAVKLTGTTITVTNALFPKAYLIYRLITVS